MVPLAVMLAFPKEISQAIEVQEIAVSGSVYAESDKR